MSTPSLHDERLRGFAWQAIIVLLLVFLGYEAISNAYDNLQRQNIATGWGFLNSTAGFAISQTLIPYSEISTYGRAFVVGLLNTLLVAVLGIVFATLLGFTVGVARLSNNWLIAKIAQCYVEFIRNVPLVLQLMFWYRAVLQALPGPREAYSIGDQIFLSNRGLMVPHISLNPELLKILLAFFLFCAFLVALSLIIKRTTQGRVNLTKTFSFIWIPFLIVILAMSYKAGHINVELPVLAGFNFSSGLQVVPEFVALLFGLTLYTAAFIAEIVRSGVQAVPKGQSEAALAMGLPRRRVLKLVVIPQALRIIIPPLSSQYLNLTKNSSLAVAIGYPELFTVAGTINNQTGQVIEVIAITMAVYLTLSLFTSLVMNWYNARIALVER